MSAISILNEVIGPVMRGPSSSHTAGAHRLASLARALLGARPVEAEFAFDPGGSYGRVYAEQGADRAFALGLMGESLIDPGFQDVLDRARDAGLRIRFVTEPLPEADHPNTVRIRLTGPGGRRLLAFGRSIGGGAIEIVSLEGWPVRMTGGGYEVAVETDREAADDVARILVEGEPGSAVEERGDVSLVFVRRRTPLPDGARSALETTAGALRSWFGTPLFFVKTGESLYRSAAELVSVAADRGVSMGRAAVLHESRLLGLPDDDVLDEMKRRLDVMLASVREGLRPDPPPMQLLRPTAGRIWAAEETGGLATGGLHTRAATRALAAMHVNGGMGVVCAAPTAGSAGVLPGLLATLVEDRGLPRDDAARCLFAAGAIGQILAERATFAAEVAGCQVEIGAAGAMAAAAVVESAGGTARQACDAAAIAFQNTMGSVCDLVQGIVEVPCHTRNAVAASSALVCADLVLGGYENPVPLDETIDVVYDVGRALPSELRCTARGGLAMAPSARAMKRLR
jgi:L-serine dehydratase